MKGGRGKGQLTSTPSPRKNYLQKAQPIKFDINSFRNVNSIII